MNDIGKLFNFPDIYADLYNLNFSLMNSKKGLKLILSCNDIINEYRQNTKNFIDLKIEHDLFQSILVFNQIKNPGYSRFLNPKIVFFKGKYEIKLENQILQEKIVLNITIDSIKDSKLDHITSNYEITDEESKIIARMFKTHKILLEIKCLEYNKTDMINFINDVGINHNKEFLQKRFKLEKEIINKETSYINTLQKISIKNFIYGYKELDEEVIYFKKLKMIKSDIKNAKGLFLSLGDIEDSTQKELLKIKILDSLHLEEFIDKDNEDVLTIIDDSEYPIYKIYQKVHGLISEWNE
jgi:hypothetical protein